MPVLTPANFEASAQARPGVLTWNQHPTLSWSDFKGRPRRIAGEPSAVTDTGFRVQLECHEAVLDIRIQVEFYTASSWVKPLRKSPELLRHEQGHFDLTELYARKMRKAIREANIACEDDRQAEGAGKKIFDQLDREWEHAEKQYDADTRDGTDGPRQHKASAAIAQGLAELTAAPL